MKNLLINRIYIVLILLSGNSCFPQNTSKLTEKELSWNPYVTGQKLIFKSSTNDYDTITILDGGNISFPDGLGVSFYNQKLRVIAKHIDPNYLNKYSETFILQLIASTPKKESQVNFSLKCKNAWFVGDPITFRQLNNMKTLTLKVPFGECNDVILIKDNTNSIDEEIAIESFYWSKSKGYLKFKNYKGISWELIKIL